MQKLKELFGGRQGMSSGKKSLADRIVRHAIFVSRLVIWQEIVLTQLVLHLVVAIEEEVVLRDMEREDNLFCLAEKICFYDTYLSCIK